MDNIKENKIDNVPDFYRHPSGSPRIKRTKGGAIGSQVLRVFKTLHGYVTQKQQDEGKIFHGLKKGYEFVGKYRPAASADYVLITGGSNSTGFTLLMSNYVPAIITPSYLEVSVAKGGEYYIVFYEFTYD